MTKAFPLTKFQITGLKKDAGKNMMQLRGKPGQGMTIYNVSQYIYIMCHSSKKNPAVFPDGDCPEKGGG